MVKSRCVWSVAQIGVYDLYRDTVDVNILEYRHSRSRDPIERLHDLKVQSRCQLWNQQRVSQCCVVTAASTRCEAFLDDATVQYTVSRVWRQYKAATGQPLLQERSGDAGKEQSTHSPTRNQANVRRNQPHVVPHATNSASVTPPSLSLEPLLLLAHGERSSVARIGRNLCVT